MKRSIAQILVIALLFVNISGAANAIGQGAGKYDVTVQGAIFGGAGDDQIKTSVSFDPYWVTEEDNTVYNGELAEFSAILCDDVYFRTKDVDRGTPNRVLYEGESTEEYDWTSFLKAVGFSDVEYIESHKVKDYAEDTNDSVTLLLAHTVVDTGYDLYMVVLRGTFSVQEWVSAFDPGCAGEAYTALTGNHPDWTDNCAFKGMDVAKNRALELISDFMEQYDDPACPNCMLITGHSRGGALANMIGAVMEDREDVKPYTYVFSAPGVTTDEKAKEYRTIFNIFDSNDFYTELMPFTEEPFYRYGRDMTMAIADSEEIRASIAQLKGRDDFSSMSAEAKAKYAELFGQRFPNRASLYTVTESVSTFDTKEEALACAENILALISSESGLGLEGYCWLNGAAGEQLLPGEADPAEAVIMNKEGKYEVSLSYCGGAVLIAYAKTLAYGTVAYYEATLQLFEADNAVCRMLELLGSNAAGLSGSHLLINGFVLSRYVAD